jgi:hypothetical protein
MRTRPRHALAAAIMASSVLARHLPRQVSEWPYSPRTPIDLRSGALAAFIVPLTDGWKYQWQGDDPLGDTWETQQPSDVGEFWRRSSLQLVTEQPNQALSILTPCSIYSLGWEVTGGHQSSMTDPSQWTVILDDEVISPDKYLLDHYQGFTHLGGSIKVTSPSILGSRNLTVLLGSQLKGSLRLQSLSCQTNLDGP